MLVTTKRFNGVVEDLKVRLNILVNKVSDLEDKLKSKPAAPYGYTKKGLPAKKRGRPSKEL
jgi:hypothetical protein